MLDDGLWKDENFTGRETGLLNPEFGIRNIIQSPFSIMEGEKGQVFIGSTRKLFCTREELLFIRCSSDCTSRGYHHHEFHYLFNCDNLPSEGLCELSQIEKKFFIKLMAPPHTSFLKQELK